MKFRRVSTLVPISREKSRSASSASSLRTRSSTRRCGSMVVSHNWSAFISPRPLKRFISTPLEPSC